MKRRLFAQTLSELIVVGLLIILCLQSWTYFTTWGLIVSSISAQIGREPMDVLAAERLRAQRFFWMTIACQTLMLLPAVWFVGRKRQSGLRGTFAGLANWLIGLGLVLLIDAVMFTGILMWQLALSRF